MRKFYVVLFLISLSVGAQQKGAMATADTYELTGNITVGSITQKNPAFTTDVSPNSFSTINELYVLLKNKGSLRLKNAILNITGTPGDKITLSFHKLELIDSHIYIHSTDVNLICNEYRQVNSYVQSFNESDSYAADGNPGATAGASGQNGEDGKDSGNMFVFVTDKIKAAPGKIDYYLWGQNGGKGGNGNTGANGANGKKGRNCSSGGYHCKAGNGSGKNGQNGGAGGNAGNGGDGGNAGNLYFRLHGGSEPSDTFFTFSTYSGSGNIAGNPASGGTGGKGGKAGDRDCGAVCKPYRGRSGADGQTGPTGLAGSHGNDGVTGALSRGVFNVQYLKSFLTSWSNGPSTTNRVEEEEVIQSSGLN